MVMIRVDNNIIEQGILLNWGDYMGVHMRQAKREMYII